MNGHAGSAPERGFTLLEVLLSMLLLSILMAMLYAALATARHLVQAGGAQARRSDAVWSVQHLLRQTLSLIQPMANGHHMQEPLPIGDASTLRYLAPAPEALAAGELQLQQLQLVPAPAGRWRLELKLAPLPASGAAPQWSMPPHVLLDDIVEGHFAYWGGGPDPSQARWFRTWNQSGRTPGLIALDLRLADAPAWPPLVVRPRIGPGDPTGALP